MSCKTCTGVNFIWLIWNCASTSGSTNVRQHQIMSLATLEMMGFHWMTTDDQIQVKEVLRLHKEGKKHTIVKNLDDYISNIGNSRCFVVINNFEGGDVGVLSYPVRLTHPTLISCIISHVWDPRVEVAFWWSHVILPRNKTIKLNIEEGSEQKYMFYNYGLGIHFYIFSASARPWNCEIQVGLFPPIRIIKEIERYPTNFEFKNFPSRHIPSRVAPVHLLLVHGDTTGRLLMIQSVITILLLFKLYHFHFSLDNYFLAEI